MVLVKRHHFSLWLLFATVLSVQSQNCNYHQYIEPGRSFSVSNPGYPKPYPGSTSCSWQGYTNEGSTVEVECRRVDLAKNLWGSCVDYLAITTGGNMRLYCKPFKVSAQSVQMVLTSSSKNGGYFQCSFSAVATQQPAPPPFHPPGSQVNGTCDCGWNRRAPRRRIVGGEEASIHEFPSMAAFINILSRTMWCGATIISPIAVLTAAHCTAGRNPAEFAVIVGEHDIDKGSDTSATALIRVSKFINHENYNTRTQKDDIALAILSSRISYNDNVGPACLPFNIETPPNKFVTVVGWGLDEFGGAPSNALMKANLRVISHNYCINTYNEYSPMTQMCTYERGKDACQYDSGGPLYDSSNARQYVMGIVSYGKDCGNLDPAVNTKVSSYLNWIRSILPDEHFCENP